jgi:mannose-1-phosphate guanylyltransferase
LAKCAIFRRLFHVKLAVFPLSAGWSDVGAWGLLWQVLGMGNVGNACRGDVMPDETVDTLTFPETGWCAVLE